MVMCGGITLKLPKQITMKRPQVRKHGICHNPLRDDLAKEWSEVVRF